MNLRSFVPPIVFSVYRRLGGPQGPKLYPSFAAAQEACQGFGYEEGNLLRCLRLKGEALRERCKTESPDLWVGELLLLNAISATGKSEVRILDHGGGPGRHYFPLRAAVPKNVRLRWCVVETPGLAREAHSLQSDELTFVDSLAAARDVLGTPDIVFSSGTLQCVPDPAAALAELCALKAPRLVLARMGGVNDGTTVTFIQQSRLSWNGGLGLPPGIQDQDARVALTYVGKRDLDAAADAAGYRVVAYASDHVEHAVERLVTGFSVLRELATSS